MRNNNTSSGGIGLAGILTIIFVIAKLTGYISWSWWWVVCPLWISMAIGLSVFVLFLVVGLLIAVCAAIFGK